MRASVRLLLLEAGDLTHRTDDDFGRSFHRRAHLDICENNKTNGQNVQAGNLPLVIATSARWMAAGDTSVGSTQETKIK